ncbi:MAG: S-methyl-5'-thioadenosine phosphorylase [archaeon]
MVKIGIIGGSGVYDPNLFEDAKKIKVHTPYGKTSSLVTVGKFKGVDMVVIARHEEGHRINPTDVNYRANIWAMKELGVTHIIATGAVGSLKEGIKPGELVFTDQFIDRTTKRKSTFYEGNQVCHISIAEPTCKQLRKILVEGAKKLGIPHHEKGTCAVIEGPRFSTKAESEMHRILGADIIGMTMVPECVLARETGICYATIALVTDYDVWKEHHVTIEEIIIVMGQNLNKFKKLVEEAIPKITFEDCECRHAIDTALI